jgi:hypothetical protein
LYEDELFRIRKTCSGEFGGSVWFKNKKTGIIRGCQALCPIAVTKKDKAFIVTASIAHGPGTIRILKISKPNKLKKISSPKPRTDTIPGTDSIYQFYYVGDFESRSLKGANVLLDTSGVIALVSYTYGNELFLVIRSTHMENLNELFNGPARMLPYWPERILLTKLIGNKLEVVDTIIDLFKMDTPAFHESKIQKVAPEHFLIKLVEPQKHFYIEVRKGLIYVYKEGSANQESN